MCTTIQQVYNLVFYTLFGLCSTPALATTAHSLRCGVHVSLTPNSTWEWGQWTHASIPGNRANACTQTQYTVLHHTCTVYVTIFTGHKSLKTFGTLNFHGLSFTIYNNVVYTLQLTRVVHTFCRPILFIS